MKNVYGKVGDWMWKESTFTEIAKIGVKPLYREQKP